MEDSTLKKDWDEYLNSIETNSCNHVFVPVIHKDQPKYMRCIYCDLAYMSLLKDSQPTDIITFND